MKGGKWSSIDWDSHVVCSSMVMQGEPYYELQENLRTGKWVDKTMQNR